MMPTIHEGSDEEWVPSETISTVRSQPSFLTEPIDSSDENYQDQQEQLFLMTLVTIDWALS